MSTGALFHNEMSEPTGVGVSLLMLSERVLTRRWCLVALMKATNLLHWASHQNDQQRGGRVILLIVVLIVTLAAAGVIRSEY